MNKKGVQLQYAFYAVLAAGLIITMVGVIISGWSNEYNSGINYDLEGDYNKVSEVSGTAKDQMNSISPNTPTGGVDAETETYRGVYGVISNIYSPFRIVFGDGGMIDAITDRFGIPNIVRQILVAMISIAFTFALVRVIFRLGGTV